MMPANDATPKHRIYLLSDVNVAPSTANSNGLRQFNGIANSGKPFIYDGQRVMVDLADIEYYDKVPALIGHDRDKRAGFGSLSVENNQLNITGTLLNNDFGREVADDADAGFPWQMSAHVMPSTEQALNEGDTYTVNGQTVTGPITILRKCKIPEVSFTPTGVDSETSAVVLGDDGYYQRKPQPAPIPPKKDNPMTIEELQKALADEQAKTAALNKENATLKAENETLKAAKNQAQVDAQLSQAGFKKSDDGKTWQGLSDSTYNVLLSQTTDHAEAMIGDLKLAPVNKPSAPDFLFGEQNKPMTQQGTGNMSQNPLIANAQARGQAGKGYV